MQLSTPPVKASYSHSPPLLSPLHHTKSGRFISGRWLAGSQLGYGLMCYSAGYYITICLCVQVHFHSTETRQSLKDEIVKSGCRQYNAECNCSFIAAHPQHCKSHKAPTTFLLHSCIEEGYSRGGNECHGVRHLVVICPIVPSSGARLFLCCFIFMLQQCWI